MARLFYLPLEPYVERYTYFMSIPNGWTETSFRSCGVDFERIDGEPLGKEIQTGVVLDAFGRSYFALSQIQKLILKIRSGDVKGGDVIFVEDFWHPGVESLFYIRHLTGIEFKVGTYCFAQSIDDTDFTYPMRSWMRPIEIGFSRGYDYVFTCSHILKRIAEDAGFSNMYKTGLAFNSTRLLEQLEEMGFDPEVREKEPFILFSSRFDWEKNPHFFMDLVEANSDLQFKLVNPRAKSAISNDPGVVERLETLLGKVSNLEVVGTTRKLDYYGVLKRAKVQFNCALQDWVSSTLLEAILFKCNPLYPNHKDFPFELQGFTGRHMYEKWDLEEAGSKLRVLLGRPFDPGLHRIVLRHDQARAEQLKIMGLL